MRETLSGTEKGDCGARIQQYPSLSAPMAGTWSWLKGWTGRPGSIRSAATNCGRCASAVPTSQRADRRSPRWRSPRMAGRWRRFTTIARSCFAVRQQGRWCGNSPEGPRPNCGAACAFLRMAGGWRRVTNHHYTVQVSPWVATGAGLGRRSRGGGLQLGDYGRRD